MNKSQPSKLTSPDIEVLPKDVSDHLRMIASGSMDAVLSSDTVLPAPSSMLWGGHEFDCEDARWRFSAGSLELHLRRPKFVRDEKLAEMFGVLNRPAEFRLDNGDVLTARLATLVERSDTINLAEQTASTTYRLVLDSWTWWPSSEQRFWVGRLIGVPRINDGNLVVSGVTWWTSSNLRLRGEYDLYIQQNRKENTATVLIDTRGKKLDQSVLGTDFLAMEFALGGPLRLDYVVAVDASCDVVGVAAPEFGRGVEAERVGRCPTALALDLYANYNEVESAYSFIPLLFASVSRRLHQDGTDSALTTAVATYVDSVAAPNIHVAYLLVQVALEALCSELMYQETGVLVADPKAWTAFVNSHEDEIRSFAIDEASARKLVNKVISAQQAPSTDRVLAALESFGINVPKAVLAEVKRRNSSAHRLVMANESTTDAQDLADRLATVQTLLAAVIAKHVDFTGPIVGWEWVRGRHKIPDDWWHWERTSAATLHFVTDEVEHHEPCSGSPATDLAAAPTIQPEGATLKTSLPRESPR